MSVYKVVELVGTSRESWVDAATNVIATVAPAPAHRIGEITGQELVIDDQGRTTFRVKLNLITRYDGEGGGSKRETGTES